MTWWLAALLGLVQGATEFLPVSSSGHLAVLRRVYESLTGSELANPQFYEVLLHMGSLCAVFIAFHKDIAELWRGFLSLLSSEGRNKESLRPSRRLILLLVIATLPMVIGALLQKQVEALSSNLFFVGMALIGTGVLLRVADRLKSGRKNGKTARVSDAAAVGLIQAAAVIPGLSRSGSTIAMGLMRDFDRQFAVKFSFLLSIPAIVGATLLKLIQALVEGIEPDGILVCLPGVLAAFVTGFLAIGLLRRMAARGKFGVFVYYCLAIGVTAIVLNFALPS
ncbi:MAG: undecaprenyl-diphosphate phosphatase [Oscillospiraceae bacterium]|jgi:undecaprenyl-diphosphatase|nr:undecaprenyl-diphosphate phosphatase [Oscillospiraceae bacterium]